VFLLQLKSEILFASYLFVGQFKVRVWNWHISIKLSIITFNILALKADFSSLFKNETHLVPVFNERITSYSTVSLKMVIVANRVKKLQFLQTQKLLHCFHRNFLAATS
jgi:hypothetical protein